MKSIFVKLLSHPLLLVLLLFTMVATTAHAVNNYYVSTSGSGSACTQANPCSSISQADAALTVGSSGTCTAGSGWLTVSNVGACVHVLSGTYNPGSFQTTKSGTSTSQIYFISENRWGAKISNSTWTQRGNWSNIEGFEMTGPNMANAVTVQTGNNKGVDYNYIHDFGTSSCTAAGIINQTNLPSHADHFNGNVIRHWGSASNSNCTHGYHGIYTDGDSVTITNNIISGGAGGWGIQRQYQPGHGSASDCAPGVISNNTIFNNAGGIVISPAGVCSFDKWTMNNNIIVNNGVAGSPPAQYGIEYFGSPIGSNNEVSNNLMYGNVPANFNCTPGNSGCPATNTKSDASTSATFVSFQSDTNAAPASNYNAANYQIKAGSSAIQNGTSTCASAGLTPCVPSLDFVGTLRPLGLALDIGAYTIPGSGGTVPSAPTGLTASVQ